MSDYISRAKAIEEINKYHMTSGVSNQGTWNECVDVIAHTISEFPSADVRENVHGKWISELELYGEGKWNYQCSVCGRSICLEQNETLDDYPFCHCGADMRGE